MQCFTLSESHTIMLPKLLQIVRWQTILCFVFIVKNCCNLKGYGAVLSCSAVYNAMQGNFDF